MKMEEDLTPPAQEVELKGGTEGVEHKGGTEGAELKGGIEGEERKGEGEVEENKGGGYIVDAAHINIIEDVLDQPEFKRKAPSRGRRLRTPGSGLVTDAGSALGSAVFCIAKCESLLNAANEEICDKKALVSVLCKLKSIKDNLGNLLDELSRAVLRVDNSDPMPQILIDEYLVKAELPEDQYNEDNEEDLDFDDYPDDYIDDQDDKDFIPTTNSKVKVEKVESKPRLYKRKQVCEHCDCRFNSILDLEEHRATCEPKGTFKCSHCDKIFPNDKRLQRHVTLKHMDLKCDVCNLSFESRKQLTKHWSQEKHYPDEQKIFCEKCNKVLLSSKAYEMHLEHFHSKKHVCSNCGEAFDVLKELRAHMRDAHDIKLKNFTCGTCNDIFHDVLSLQQHMSATNHSTSSTCEYCGKVCASEGTLKVHMKIKHTLKFKCEECGEMLESKMDMRKHKAAKHAPEQPSQYVCSTCGHSTKNKDAFRHHLKIHQAKKHKCDVCEKLFTLKHSLTTHYRIHTGEKPLVCTICGMRFRKSSGLCQHRAIHTGEKPYVCQLCGKGFVQKGGLKTHMKSHISGSLPMLKE